MPTTRRKPSCARSCKARTPACRCGEVRSTTSSACCMPRTCCRALNEAGNDFAQIDIMKIASKPWFVPDTTQLQDQLNAFLRRKAHFAIVVDEYGEVEGLVTLEDIIEEIVGEIADEHDIDIQGVQARRPTGRWWSKARCRSATSTGPSTGNCPTRGNDHRRPRHPRDAVYSGREAGLHLPRQALHRLKRDKNRLARIRIRPAGEKFPFSPVRSTGEDMLAQFPKRR